MFYFLNGILGLMVSIFVYSDAKTRRMNAGFWLLIVLLLGMVGVVLYLLLRYEGVTYKKRDSKLVSLSNRYNRYDGKLIDNKRIYDEMTYNEGIKFVLKTARYRDMSLEEIEYFLINLEDDESIIDDYVKSNLKDNESYKKGVIQGLKRLLDIKKYGKSTI